MRAFCNPELDFLNALIFLADAATHAEDGYESLSLEIAPYALSNSDFKNSFGEAIPETTCLAHSKYCCFLSRLQPMGGLEIMARRFEILSASLSVCARGDFSGVCSTCNCFLVSFGSDLSSVTSATSPATSFPNRCSSSCKVTPVSSTVSCKKAAITSSTSR